MKLSQIIDIFIHAERFKTPEALRRARLLVRASLLTCAFSCIYLIASLIFEFDIAFYIMIASVIGFLILPLLLKTSLSINWIGNLYIFLGAYAIILLVCFSGGIESAIYPWIISIPIITLLVVNRQSAYFWGIISFVIMIAMGIATINGYVFPIYLNNDLRAEWITVIVPGLMLILLFVALIFEFTQRKTLFIMEEQNILLHKQKETIEDQKKKLSLLVDDKDYIIRILAHDLRSPLNNIKGLIKLIQLESDVKNIEKYHSHIWKTTLDAESLVNRVLEMDKSEQSVKDLQKTSVNVFELILQLNKRMQFVADNKSISIHTYNKANQHLIKSDKIYLRLIFENLISNAIKFSLANSTIKINLSNYKDKIRINISDEGLGISPDDENLLFTKFARLKTKPTAGESSTGLGLSLVKRYVELLDGEVWYVANPELVGATFIVELPLLNEFQ